MDLNRLLVEVTALAREAGRAILDVYASSFSVQEKEDRSPLTEADLRSEKLILAGLKRIAPEIPVLSEESAQAPYAARRNWSRLWVVDPLDGTKEFVQRNGEFTVNIALVDRQRPVLGMDFQGSRGASAGPCCSSSIEMLSGERTKAMWPSRGGRLMVTPERIRRSQVAYMSSTA